MHVYCENVKYRFSTCICHGICLCIRVCTWMCTRKLCEGCAGVRRGVVIVGRVIANASGRRVCPDESAFEHAWSIVTWHETYPECDNRPFARSSVQPFVDAICGSAHTHMNKHTDSEEEAPIYILQIMN